MQISQWRENDYNGLLEVVDAWEALKGNPAGAQTIEALGGIIRSSGLTNEIGLCLLHRHFLLSPGERVVHTSHITDGKVELASAPQAQHAPNINVAPCRYRFTRDNADESITATEFSDDPLVAANSAALLSNDSVLGTLRAEIVREGLENLLGVAVWGEREAHIRNSSQVLVEETRTEHRVSSLTIAELKAFDTLKVIETNWGFRTNERAAIVMWGCISICVRYAPGHSIQHRRCTRYV